MLDFSEAREDREDFESKYWRMGLGATRDRAWRGEKSEEEIRWKGSQGRMAPGGIKDSGRLCLEENGAFAGNYVEISSVNKEGWLTEVKRKKT